MQRQSQPPHSKWVRSLGAVALLATVATAQFAERPSLAGSGKPDVDCSGRSIKNKRVRAVNTNDPSLVGGTAYLIERDPFLAYQLGRNLNFREFRTRDGVFSSVVSGLAGPMPDGTTAKITNNNQVSCVGCHNLPQGNPGGGTNFSKDSGFGRNAPHYYGAGIMEMLALQIREDMLWRVDTDRNGWVSIAEAQKSEGSLFVQTSPGSRWLDFGDPRLSNGSTGSPSFNNIFRVWYVDANGVVVPGATEVDGQTTFGYNFEMVVWGWGQGEGRSALNPTNRVFLWDPLLTHGGLDSWDPVTTNDPDGDGVSLPTLAGAVQFPVTHSAPDKGNNLHPQKGFSMDDPDGDGHLAEITAGDLDLGEWFMLNAPRPAFAGTPQEYARGVRLLNRMQCTTCHVPDWQIHAKADPSSTGPQYAGDRRFIDFDVQWNARARRLEGRLARLYDKNGADYERRYESYYVQGLFSDLRQHEMGPGFTEFDFGGTQNTVWRTPPLWGVAQGFPWGHDGQSMSLEDVIRRHGGEAEASRQLWDNAPRRAQEELIGFLRKLVLYDIETLPADIDGDGSILNNFIVAGQDTGVERFNAEWLFNVPLQIQGPIQNVNGITVTSFAGVNIDAAYGQNMPYRIDSDDDGWPDVWDTQPNVTGYKNGAQ